MDTISAPPLRAVSTRSRDNYDHERPPTDDAGEVERAPPSPLLQPTQADERDAFLQHERSSSVSPQKDPAPVYTATKQASKSTSSTTLHRSAYVLILVLLYSGLALFAWVVTCILTHRPITAKHYGAWIFNKENDGYGWTGAGYINSLYVKNENWYRTARVLQSIVSVLTIPLTSAVCSSAAVIFVQHNRKTFGLSMRQVMVLADKGWTDPATYARLFLTSKGWKRYGSSFLFLTILLIILGGVISPIQEVFLSTKTIKTPTWPQMVSNLIDIPDQFLDEDPKLGETQDLNLIPILTRNALLTATNTQPQSLMWQGAGFTCNVLDLELKANNHTSDGSVPPSCGTGATFGNLSMLTHPFIAQLPSGYNTGLIRQFIPRINSTAQYENISSAEYPIDCDKVTGAFFVDYGNTTSDEFSSSWGLQACMPRDLRQSPWKSTRDRQDFSEELYINVTTISVDVSNIESGVFVNGSAYYRVTVNTTAGYFELPNYMNDQVAGNLLEKDPNSLCGPDCEGEGTSRTSFIPDIYDHNIPNKTRRQVTLDDPESSLALENVFNKGPLLTTTMALFGEGSFLANHLKTPQAYYGVNVTMNSDGTYSPTNAGACMDLAPLGFLLADDLGQTVVGNQVDYCIRNNAGGRNGNDIQDEMISWITNFANGNERLSNAFTAAAFLANQAWMLNNQGTGHKSLSISYDLGADSEVPVISRAGIILISVLLGLDLLALLVMAIYATIWPRWTNQLDSFTMLRLGAAMAEKVPLMVGRRTDHIKALDEIPGWIGDVAEPDEEFGRLGLGAPTMVSRKRRYRCYDGDDEPLSVNEKTAFKKRAKEAWDQGLPAAGVTALDAVGVRI